MRHTVSALLVPLFLLRIAATEKTRQHSVNDKENGKNAGGKGYKSYSSGQQKRKWHDYGGYNGGYSNKWKR